MLEACDCMGEQERAAFFASAFAAAVRRLLQTKSGGRPGGKKCFNCGKLGHFKAQCKVYDKTSGEKPCDRCGKRGRMTKECKSKCHVSGRVLGNPRDPHAPRHKYRLSGQRPLRHRRTCQSGCGNGSRSNFVRHKGALHSIKHERTSWSWIMCDIVGAIVNISTGNFCLARSN